MSRYPRTVADYAALRPNATTGPLDYPVLKYAVMQKAPREAILDLVRRGAKASLWTGGNVLHLLAWYGYRADRDAGQDWRPRDLIRTLVRDGGVNPDEVDNQGHPPLWWALNGIDASGDDSAIKGLYEAGADLFHPSLTTHPSPLLAKMRALKSGVEAATASQKDRIIREAITQQAEARGQTGIPPDVPGPSIAPYLAGIQEGPKQSPGTPNDLRGRGRKSKKARRHRKFTRRHRKTRI